MKNEPMSLDEYGEWLKDEKRKRFLKDYLSIVLKHNLEVDSVFIKETDCVFTESTSDVRKRILKMRYRPNE